MTAAKQFLIVSILVVLVLLTLPATVQAQDYTYITVSSTITNTGYIGTNTVVTIPDAIGGLPVKRGLITRQG